MLADSRRSSQRLVVTQRPARAQHSLHEAATLGGRGPAKRHRVVWADEVVHSQNLSRLIGVVLLQLLHHQRLAEVLVHACRGKLHDDEANSNWQQPVVPRLCPHDIRQSQVLVRIADPLGSTEPSDHYPPLGVVIS